MSENVFTEILKFGLDEWQEMVLHEKPFDTLSPSTKNILLRDIINSIIKKDASAIFIAGVMSYLRQVGIDAPLPDSPYREDAATNDEKKEYFLGRWTAKCLLLAIHPRVKKAVTAVISQKKQPEPQLEPQALQSV